MQVPPFVDAGWLATHLDEVVTADVRWSLDGSHGHATYLRAHLPEAVFVDLEHDLSGPQAPRSGRHPLPTPDAFAAALGARGIGDDDPVVAYDQDTGAVAARLVWMLRAVGQPAAVLTGGLAGWDGPVASGESRRPPVPRTVRPWPPHLLADADLVDELRADPGAVVLDAREPARYRGEVEPVDARPGHIPGARNLPVSALVDPSGRPRPDGELRRVSAEAGVDPERVVVASCGSGVTACFDLLVLEHLGVRGRLFPGSWSAWAADPERPAATGPSPG